MEQGYDGQHLHLHRPEARRSGVSQIEKNKLLAAGGGIDLDAAIRRMKADPEPRILRAMAVYVNQPPCSALIQFPHPNVPEADRRARIAVGLQFDGCAIELLVRGLADVEGFAF